MSMIRSFIAVVVAFAGISAASAQPAPTTNYTSFEAEPGKSMQIAFYARANNDCSPSKLPVVRVVESPTLGTLTVRPSDVTTSKVANCPNLRVPGQLVLYTARDKAEGNDHVMYSVTFPDGQIMLYDVTVHVKELPKENKL